MTYLPPTRELRERLDAAQTLSGLFYREEAIVLACGGFVPHAPRLEAKAELGRTAWESALAADALRERVFELRYPSRFLDEPGEEIDVAGAGELAGLIGRQRDDYRAYLDAADELADGPSIRLVAAALRDKDRQVEALAGLELTDDDPARDGRYFPSSFYWPDVLDPDYPYGEGTALQLRSAVSHLNEVWAVETAGRILRELSPELGWGFTNEAARWLYDETRHMLMGKERLEAWALPTEKIPLGGYIYEAWQHEDPLYGLGMLGYFETKNIGRKRERARAFEAMGDRTSETDMEFDWADETLHAEYGRRWLRRLLEARGRDPESWPQVLERCEQLVQARVDAATPEDLERIRTCADALVRTATDRARCS
ncbi:MAG TPA: hypothetical protein VFA24_05015 [Gaiellaceae bacterium]|nr:hypothetical protein [Gaiellaceae bacterium]